VILVFDTETTGLPVGLPTASAYPKMVQLAWICLNYQMDTLGEQQLLIDPGVDIPTAASDIHGITTEIAQATGTHSKFALKTFLWVASKADIVVAHNLPFDDKIIEHETWRHGLLECQEYRYYKCASRIDTCSRNMLKMPKPPEPGKRASDKIKLEEAHAQISQIAFRAHNGLEDTRTCAGLLKHAIRIGTVNLDKLREESIRRTDALEEKLKIQNEACPA
jgi:DNA polymerase III epsilon subunit-like protein